MDFHELKESCATKCRNRHPLEKFRSAVRGRLLLWTSYRRKQKNIVIVPAKVVSVVNELLYLISEQVVVVLQRSYCFFFLLFLQVQPRLINPLKNLRRLGLKLVAEFFSDYETYSFSVEEIDAVFHAVVWPQVSLSRSSKQLVYNAPCREL